MNLHPPHPQRIRLATTQDLTSLVCLENQIFDYDQLKLSSFRRHISKKNLWLFEVDQTIAGYILVLKRVTSKKLRIYSVAVGPEFQGKGIGRKLIEYVIRHATSNNYCSLKLEVKVDNESAIKLYESLGFTQIERIKGFYSDGQDAFVYERIFAQS